MPHCWCNPRKEVMPNGNMVIVHNVECEECGNLVEDENTAVQIYLCKKCDAKNWFTVDSPEGKELLANDPVFTVAPSVESPYKNI